MRHTTVNQELSYLRGLLKSILNSLHQAHSSDSSTGKLVEAVDDSIKVRVISIMVSEAIAKCVS